MFTDWLDSCCARALNYHEELDDARGYVRAPVPDILQHLMQNTHLKNIRAAFKSSQVGSSVAPAVDKKRVSPSLQASLNHGGVAILGC